MLRSVLVSVAVLAFLAGPASAEVTFDWVAVGNLNNAADPFNEDDIPGIGTVGYEYLIAKHEVTNDQYAEFLNAVAATDANALYNTEMDSDPRGGITSSGSSGSFTYSAKTNMGSKPVVYVSFFDAMRLVNWLHNGQTTGAQGASTTEDGVYTISDGVSETQAGYARFSIPTENEWYKAAYHQPSVGKGWKRGHSTFSSPIAGVLSSHPSTKVECPLFLFASQFRGRSNGHGRSQASSADWRSRRTTSDCRSCRLSKTRGRC